MCSECVFGQYACLVWTYREDREEEGRGRREEGGGKREEGAQGVEGEHRGYLRHADRAC